MTKKGTISTFQMSAILLLCRMTALFTFMLPTTGFLLSGDRVLTVLPLLLTELFTGLIAVRLINSTDSKSIISETALHSQGASRLSAVIYFLTFIWFAGISAARFELFISTVMFPNSELFLMTIILVAASFYAALKGLEAMGRASVILSVILALSIAFILLTVSRDFEYTNLKPVLTEGISPVISFALYASARSVELITLYVTAPHIKGNIRKMTLSWIITVSITTAVILFFLAGVTGEYGDDQIFPLYTLTVIAKFGIFERLDDILSGLWVLSTFIQLSFLLIAGNLAIRQGFGIKKKIPVLITECIAVLGIYFISSQTVTAYSEIISSVFQDILFVTVMLILPIALTLLNHTKKRKKVCTKK